MSDLISVIVPVYNTELYLQECLLSIQRQTYDNLEVILVDDDSSDKSGEICERFAEKDKRFKVIHQKNMGQGSARNRGLKEANGKYIGFIDSDDYIEPKMFEEMYNAAQSSGAHIVICGFKRFEKMDKEHLTSFDELGKEEAVKMLLEDIIITSHMWNKLFLRELFDGIELPNEKRYQDTSVMHLLFLRTNKVKMVNRILYHYRVRKGSTTDMVWEKRFEEYLEVYEKRCNDLKNTMFYGYARTVLMKKIRGQMLYLLVKRKNKASGYKELEIKIKKMLEEEKDLLDKKEVCKTKIVLIFPGLCRQLKILKTAIFPQN